MLRGRGNSNGPICRFADTTSQCRFSWRFLVQFGLTYLAWSYPAAIRLSDVFSPPPRQVSTPFVFVCRHADVVEFVLSNRQTHKFLFFLLWRLWRLLLREYLALALSLRWKRTSIGNTDQFSWSWLQILHLCLFGFK